MAHPSREGRPVTARKRTLALSRSLAARARAADRRTEQEIERLQRTEEAIVVATGAPREREKREAAEIEAAKERDRQAYRERGWPSDNSLG